ncbi:hypothetical protein R6Q59_006554 [Mikania micrantha]
MGRFVSVMQVRRREHAGSFPDGSVLMVRSKESHRFAGVQGSAVDDPWLLRFVSRKGSTHGIRGMGFQKQIKKQPILICSPLKHQRNIYLRLKDSFNTYSDSRTRNHTLAFFVIFFWRGLRSSVGEYKIAEEAHIKAIQIDEKSVEACGHLAQFSFVAGELEHARVHPKFLHSNATSHKWAFGAIAELLDNAVDEVNNGATFVKVDRVYSKIDNSPSLLFLDDGGGMDPDGMRKCMSLCYSTKKTNNTIGQYGNGFKTSTMQLGADVIVFSRACRNGRATQSVGLLSYTFLRKTGQDDVIVPMIDFDISKHWSEPILYGTQEDWSTNLKTILEWSPFNSKDDLIQQFEDIGPHGKKIVIYNLWLNDEGVYELNFDEDDEDIKLIDETAHLSKLSRKAADKQSHISYRLLHSLRAYASMLYLRKFKNFKIILRGKPVEQYIISDDLKYPEVVIYKPQVSSTKQDRLEMIIDTWIQLQDVPSPSKMPDINDGNATFM